MVSIMAYTIHSTPFPIPCPLGPDLAILPYSGLDINSLIRYTMWLTFSKAIRLHKQMFDDLV